MSGNRSRLGVGARRLFLRIMQPEVEKLGADPDLQRSQAFGMARFAS